MKRILLTACVLLALPSAAAAETRIEIQGMKSKSEGEVLRLMAGRLEYVRSKPATSWRANDAAFLVTEVLRNDGFKGVVVIPQVEASDRIVLKVQEGVRFALGKVEILGDADPEGLAKIYEVPANRDTPFGAGSPPFRVEDVETGLLYIGQQLKSEGYWEAKVELRKQDFDPETGKVNVSISVDRGERFRIGKPSVLSPDGRGVKRAAETSAPFIGAWATTEKVNALRAAMVEAFNSRGYPNAQVVMLSRLSGSTYYPEFEIRLGTRVKLLGIRTEGLERTSESRVKQIMRPLEGDWYDEAAMNRKVRDLLGTGAFESVRVETHEVAMKRIDATLHFEEADAKEVTLAAGVDSFSGPLLRAGFTDRNFRGDLRGLSTGLEISARGALGELKLTNPWWLGTDTKATYRLFSLVKAYAGYTSIETGIEGGWAWDVSEHYAMELLLGYSFVTVAEDGLPSEFLGTTDYSHLRLSFTQKWDYRDNRVLPKDGWHLSVPLQIGATTSEGSSNYAKLGVKGGWYHPINASYSVGVGGFANWVFTAGDIMDLPVDLRVFNGGARSVRSFPEMELGPSFGGDAYGGDFSWAVNTELGRRITDSVTAVAFIDVGQVTGTYIGLKDGGVEIAAGLGVRFDLPIGPVRLEYGQNLTRGPGEPSGTLHFAIGATF